MKLRIEALRSLRDWISVEGGSYHRYFGRWVPSGVHVWIGPFGLHLFWPGLWKSRPDYCWNWRESEQERAAAGAPTWRVYRCKRCGWCRHGRDRELGMSERIGLAPGRLYLPAVLSDQLGISSSEARRIINQGGVKLDGEAVVDFDPPAEYISGKTLKVGKKQEVRVP